MNANVQVKTITVPANGVTSINATGSFLLLQASTGTFNFSLDGGAFQTGITVLTIDVAREPNLLGSVSKPALVSPQFNSILLQDTSGAPNAITFVVANFPVTYSPPLTTAAGGIYVKMARTFTIGYDVVNYGDGGFQNFPGTAHGPSVRKQILVFNFHATKWISICDQANNAIGICLPLSSWTAETSDVINVINPTGNGANNIVVGEIYYQNQ